MSERRCSSCGGLVGADAEWCGQCLARVDAAEGREPSLGSAPSSTRSPGAGVAPGAEDPADGRPSRAIRVEAGRPVWRCPSCGLDNAIDDDLCATCSYRFADLFGREAEEGRRVSSAVAAMLSAVIPGAGHVAAGRAADGVARFVVFAFALGTALVTLVWSRGGGALVPLGGLALASAVAVYVTGTIDASRVAEGREPVVRNRVLLYGAIALMLLTVVVLVVSGLRVSSAR